MSVRIHKGIDGDPLGRQRHPARSVWSMSVRLTGSEVRASGFGM